MRKSGLEASNYMKRLSLTGARGVKGWCLKTCRLAWDLGVDEESAIKEWESIPDRFKNDKPNQAPVGAPHFWRVGKFGHVAIQSEERGKVWSTDAPVGDMIGLVGIPWFERKWGAEYLGWSSQFQNKRLPLDDEPAPKAVEEEPAPVVVEKPAVVVEDTKVEAKPVKAAVKKAAPKKEKK